MLSHDVLFYWAMGGYAVSAWVLGYAMGRKDGARAQKKLNAFRPLCDVPLTREGRAAQARVHERL